MLLLGLLAFAGCPQQRDEAVFGVWRVDLEATFDNIGTIEAYKALDYTQQLELMDKIRGNATVTLTFTEQSMRLSWQGEQFGQATPHDLVYRLEHLQKNAYRAVHPDTSDPDKTFTMTLKPLNETGTRMQLISERFQPWMRYVIWGKVAQ
ncbi:MAG: hypothetical protein ACFBZ8_10855 [Opitutales bacterium]